MDNVSLGLSISPPVIALVGNAVYVDAFLRSSTGDPVSDKVIRFDIMTGNVCVYSGSAITDPAGNISVQINEIMSHYCAIPEYRNEGVIFSVREDLSTTFDIKVSYAGITASAQLLAIYGRVPLRIVRYLQNRNSNIFTFKLLNKQGNFFAITRSKGKVITMYESELMPLMGIGTGDVLSIKNATGKVAAYTPGYLKPYQLSIPLLVREYGKVLTITLGSGSDITIKVVPDKEESGTTLLEYRNTFGMMERFLAVGTASWQLNTNEIGDTGYYEKYTEQRIPNKIHPTYDFARTISTGYLNSDRIDAVRALLVSEEVYIVRDNDRERVLVSCSDKTPEVILEPLNIVLNVTSISSDTGFLPDLNSQDYDDPRLHNNYFNTNYN